MNRRGARAPGASRLLVLCAVLCGVFLMHGAPASAAGGCHDAMAMSAAPSAPMPTGTGHLAEPDERAAHGAVRAAPAPPGAAGESCVSTRARDRSLPPLTVLGSVAPAAWVLPGRTAAPEGPERRGPPYAGRGLLLQVCVART
ncbi:hypothetical protein [Streptomyces sp. NPDC014734]|uniref:hypothetical protein n=1 Tax=Streptomyces sp. NPDC014734 TaxID=3364886 RepID=UPI0037034BE0